MAARDRHYMECAFELAQRALKLGDVPVGAVLVVDGKILGCGLNTRHVDRDIFGHAEVVAMNDASSRLRNWQIRRSTLYVTLEPCLMCSGAILQARISRVVFAARDPKAGALRSLYAVGNDPRLNHQLDIREGLMAEQSAQLLRTFFEKLRQS